MKSSAIWISGKPQRRKKTKGLTLWCTSIRMTRQDPREDIRMHAPQYLGLSQLKFSNAQEYHIVDVTCKIWSQILSEIKFEISTPKRKPSSFLTLVQTWSTELKKQRYWLPSNGYGMMIGDNLWSLYSYFFVISFCQILHGSCECIISYPTYIGHICIINL